MKFNKKMKLSENGGREQVASCRLQVAGLDTGCWLLVAGCWILDAGQTRNSKPGTRNPKLETRNSELELHFSCSEEFALFTVSF